VGSGKAVKDAGDVRRFLNRLLGLPLGCQNLLFNYFAASLAAEIGAAKAEGRYSEGVSDLQVCLVRVFEGAAGCTSVLPYTS
jgi:hypothetical protein